MEESYAKENEDREQKNKFNSLIFYISIILSFILLRDYGLEI